MYMPLNIFIALIGVVVWSEGDQIEISGNGDNVLNDFLNYRRERLYETHPNDNAQLLTYVNHDVKYATVLNKFMIFPHLDEKK